MNELTGIDLTDNGTPDLDLTYDDMNSRASLRSTRTTLLVAVGSSNLWTRIKDGIESVR